MELFVADDAADATVATEDREEPIEAVPLMITVVPPFLLDDELLFALETEEDTHAGKFTNSHPPWHPLASQAGVVQ